MSIIDKLDRIKADIETIKEKIEDYELEAESYTEDIEILIAKKAKVITDIEAYKVKLVAMEDTIFLVEGAVEEVKAEYEAKSKPAQQAFNTLYVKVTGGSSSPDDFREYAGIQGLTMPDEIKPEAEEESLKAVGS